MGKLSKAFITMGLIASLLPCITGCSSELPEHVQDLNYKIVNVLKNEVSQKEGKELLDYQFIGADVAKTAFNYGVRFNGVATLSDGEQAFASLDYAVPSQEFLHLKKASGEEKVYDVLEKVVQSYKPTSYSITPVTNLVNVNDAFVRNAPTPFEGYNIDDAMIYNLGAPVFDDQNLTVSFDVKLLMELSRVKRKDGWGVCLGFDGQVCFGYGIPIPTSYAEGSFTTIDKYIIKVDKQAYEAMKANPKAVYDACVDAINGDNSIKLDADRKLTTMVTYDAADLLEKLDMTELVDGLER